MGNWCIMEDLKLSAAVVHKKKDGCGSNFIRFSSEVYVLPCHQFFAFELSVLVFGYIPHYTQAACCYLTATCEQSSTVNTLL